MRLFSRRPGTEVVIPGTTQIARIFPRRIEIGDHAVEIDAPSDKFVVFQDLVRGEIHTSHFRLTPHLETKYPVEGSLPDLVQQRPQLAQLSFGCHKKLEWERVWERCDPQEFLPIWFALGQWTPSGEGEVTGEWVDLFRARFRSMMLPCRGDPWHLGLDLPDCDPMALLSSGATRIRRLIVDDDLTIRPPFHSGRLLDLHLGDLKIDLEWSNKRMRTLRLRSETDREITLRLRERRFRLRGRLLDAREPFALSRGEEILLDRFEK